jgi:excisionase family DNA binding protein
MVKKIGTITLYSVTDLHEALGVNERTIRDWFNKGRLKGQKVGKEWVITEDNLKAFFDGEKGGENLRPKKKTKVKEEV